MKTLLSSLRRLQIKLDLEKTLWQMIMQDRKSGSLKTARRLRKQERQAKRSSIGRRLSSDEKAKRESILRKFAPPSEAEITKAIEKLFNKLHKTENNTDKMQLLQERLLKVHPDLNSSKKSIEKQMAKTQEKLKRADQLKGASEHLFDSLEQKVRALEDEAFRTKVPPLGPVRIKVFQWAEEMIQKTELRAACSIEIINEILSEEFGGIYGNIEKIIIEREGAAENARNALTALLSKSAIELKEKSNPSRIEDLFLVIRVTKSIRDSLADKEEPQIKHLVENINKLLDLWMERLEVLVKEQADKIRQAQS